MRKNLRDAYLGAAQDTLPSLSDPTISKGTLPKHLENAGEGALSVSSHAGVSEPEPLNANLAGQLALFELFACEVRHKIESEMTKKQRLCD